MTYVVTASLQGIQGWPARLDDQQEPSSSTCWDLEILHQHLGVGSQRIVNIASVETDH
jgi:hypothetical protein